MSIFDKVVDLFKYAPVEHYNFILMGDEQKEKDISYNDENKDNSFDSKEVYSDLSKNLEYINIKFNTLINSDIVVREFNIYARNKQYSAFLFYIDGMSNSQLINDFVIKPLMLRNKANTFEENKIVGNTETNLNSQKVNKRKTYIK